MEGESRRLTILQVAYPLAPVGPDAAGGAEQVLYWLDAELAASGHRSLVIACAGSRVAGRLIAGPAPGAAIGPADGAAAAAAWRRLIAETLAREPVDLIHLHGIDCHRYLPAGQVPRLLTLHLPPSWYRASILADPGLCRVCVSAAQRAACPPGTRIDAVVSNGIPVDRFGPARSKRGFALALGRICPEKGFHLALDAARRADVPLLLAGPVFGYPAHQAYFAQEILPRLDRWRRYLGPVGFAAKRRLLAWARCLVVPSLVDETCCLAAWEALASGTPVIGFARGALPEAVRSGVTGFLVDDVDTMADAIGTAEALDPAACRAAAQPLSTAAMARRYLGLYQAVLDRGAAAA